MKESDLKIKIFREIDLLESNNLKELYGLMLNYIYGKDNIEEWDKLSDKERSGIEDAVIEIESGKSIQHEKVIRKFRKNYLNA